jgi:hypothetical protein
MRQPADGAINQRRNIFTPSHRLRLTSPVITRFAMKTIAAIASLLLSVAAFQTPAGAWEKRCLACGDAPRPHYDSQEVVKTHQDIDRSRVISTRTVIKRVRVVEAPLVVRVPVVKVIEVVVQPYRMVEVMPYTTRVYHRPAHYRPLYRCVPGDGCHRVLHARG